MGLSPEEGLNGLRHRLYRIASLVGWADSRLRSRVERVARLEARAAEACAKYVNHEADTRPRGGMIKDHLDERDKGEYAIEFLDLSCGDDVAKLDDSLKLMVDLMHEGPIRCIVRFRVVNTGNATLTHELYDFGWRAVVGLSDGHTRRAPLIQIEHSGAKIPESESGRIELPPRSMGTALFGFGSEQALQGAGAPQPRLMVINPGCLPKVP